DVNGSSSVTTADITLIRRLILNIATDFPGGLWRLIRSDYAFPNPQSPWGADGTRSYANLNVDAAGQDFIAVKQGDVNSSWTPIVLATTETNRRGAARLLGPSPGPTVGFAVSSHTALPGQVLEVSVGLSDFRGVTSAQFTLGWDPTVLRYEGTGNYGLAGIGAGSFGTTQTGLGRLAFSWDDLDAIGVTAADGTVLYTVSFTVVGGDGARTAVALMDDPTLREVTVNFELAGFGSQDGSVTVGHVIAAPQITQQPQTQTITGGGSIVLSVVATGTGPLTYQWLKDGAPIPGATGVTLTLTGVQMADAGGYTVEVSNAGGKVSSDPAAVTVTPAAPVLGIEMYAGIVIQGTVGATYTIQYTPDTTAPIQWQSLVDVTLTRPVEVWIDPDSPGQRKGFYRAVVKQP
ncbi:MAG: hypothetical protein FJ387_20680, partial [Verrucomicrobia bacterium]|nr:hypothetical protein [Verrucomicrobiota bacterium]